jgi:hypothetical protein
MNYYPREYLELWDIKEEMARSKEEAQQLKQTWKTAGYQVASKTISFSDLARCSAIQVYGLKDRTNTKTPEEIKKELKTLF